MLIAYDMSVTLAFCPVMSEVQYYKLTSISSLTVASIRALSTGHTSFRHHKTVLATDALAATGMLPSVERFLTELLTEHQLRTI